jgi:hypothetical protein
MQEESTMAEGTIYRDANGEPEADPGFGYYTRTYHVTITAGSQEEADDLFDEFEASFDHSGDIAVGRAEDDVQDGIVVYGSNLDPIADGDGGTYLVEMFWGGCHGEDIEASTPEERDAAVARYTAEAVQKEEGYIDIYVVTFRGGKQVSRELVDLGPAFQAEYERWEADHDESCGVCGLADGFHNADCPHVVE